MTNEMNISTKRLSKGDANAAKKYGKLPLVLASRPISCKLQLEANRLFNEFVQGLKSVTRSK